MGDQCVVLWDYASQSIVATAVCRDKTQAEIESWVLANWSSLIGTRGAAMNQLHVLIYHLTSNRKLVVGLDDGYGPIATSVWVQRV